MDNTCVGCRLPMKQGPRVICQECWEKRDRSVGELTVKVEVAPWYTVLTDAVVEAITTAAQAGMPVHVAHQLMRATTSTAMADAIVVSTGKGTPPPLKI